VTSPAEIVERLVQAVRSGNRPAAYELFADEWLG
jgi:hypothetical protein